MIGFLDIIQFVAVFRVDLVFLKNEGVLKPSIYYTTQVAIFTITDAKLYVPVVTLSTHDNAKLLEQLTSGLKEQLNGININLK